MTAKYITSLDQVSKLSRIIIKNYPWGFQGATVEGPRGRGKTSYCIHVMREVYQFLDGLSRDDAYEKILGVGNYSNERPKILFSMKDVVNALEILDSIDMKDIRSWQENNTIPCYTWDDAGMHGGKYKFFVNVRLVDYLKGLIDTIRFVTSGFLINAPELSGLLGFLRDYKDQFVIKITYRSEGKQDGGKYGRLAVARQFYETRSGRKQKRVVFKTKFSCYVDDWAYNIYLQMKAKAIIENRRQLKRMIEIARNRGEVVDDVMNEMGVPEEYKPLVKPSPSNRNQNLFKPF